jgi:hypothetical protein
MKSLFFILSQILLVLAFSAAPTASVSACGNEGGDCCDKKEAKHESQSGCCSEKSGCSQDSNEGNGCGGDCGKNGCPCPTTNCSHAPAAALTDALMEFPKISSNVLPAKMAWYFKAKKPKPVWLAIWLPPKLTCSHT